MACEVERKYLHVNFAELRSHLQKQAAVCLGRHFERNVVYETDPPSFCQQKKLLRLRSCFWAERTPQYVLTFKAPAAQAEALQGFKVRREDEVFVSSAESMGAILEGQGFVPWACYEKVRETWQVSAVSVVLDVLPFGRFVELEGDAVAIDAFALTLDLAEAEQSTQSYAALYRDWLQAMGKSWQASFMFSEQERKAWTERLGIYDLPELPRLCSPSLESCLQRAAGV